MLVVLRLSDAFADFWVQLAEHVGAELVAVDDPGSLPDLRGAAAVLVAAGGVEDRAAEAVRAARAAAAESVAVVGAAGDYRVVLALCQAGASSYFAVPGDLSALRSWVAERVKHQRELARTRLHGEARRRSDHFAGIVGRSPALRGALEDARRVIPRGDVTVLVTGETGTGKELLARAIHGAGPRAQGPFVEVNCAALPAALLESELFGYERGAFPEARAARAGLLEVARGGTLLLDELADMPLEVQAKLLRVVDTRSVRRLGGLRESAVDVRIMAATHADLPAAVAAGRFRADLFYRLAVVPIHLPPLRGRDDDAVLLAEHYLELLGAQYAVQPPPLSPRARQALLTHRWPGNVRELRNAVERAVLLAEGSLDHFDPNGGAAPATPEPASPIPFPATLERMSRAAARATLDRFDGNKSEAARVLGITRKHLYALLGAPAGAAREDG